MNATGGEPKILFSYSTNGGATFQPECIISLISGQVDSAAFSFPTEVIPQTNPANMILQSPIPFVAPNGNVYIVWMQNNGTSAYNACEQKFIKSTDGGVSFGPVRSLANFTHEIAGDWCHLRFRHWPSFAIDGLTGYLYVVYRDRESQFSSTPRIKFVRSTNNGISWSTPIIIGNLGELGETFPWVATNSLGKVAVSFLHKKNTGLIDCYVIESENSGVSFGNSVLVSTEASTSCGFYVASFDYQGIVIDNLGNDYVVWTDFSSENGNGDPFFSKVNTTPSTPGGFYISGNVGQNPTLHWNLFGTDIANYKIYYKVNNGNENLLVTVSGSTNSFTDPGVVITGNKRDDEFCYRISAVDYASQESPKTNWACVFSNIINKDPITNENYKEEISFKLEEAYPNPFNPSTSINYSIPEKSFITLQVYDLLGIKKAELVSEQKEPGSYVVEFNASKYPSGVYIYILQSGEYVSSKKMLLIK